MILVLTLRRWTTRRSWSSEVRDGTRKSRAPVLLGTRDHPGLRARYLAVFTLRFSRCAELEPRRRRCCSRVGVSAASLASGRSPRSARSPADLTARACTLASRGSRVRALSRCHPRWRTPVCALLAAHVDLVHDRRGLPEPVRAAIDGLLTSLGAANLRCRGHGGFDRARARAGVLVFFLLTGIRCSCVAGAIPTSSVHSGSAFPCFR